MPTHIPPDPTTKDRVRRVFSFLRELHQLRSKLVRRVQEHPWHLELGSLPRDPRITCTRDSTPEAAEETFRLTVERVTLNATPRPPEKLLPYLPKGWDDPTKGAPALTLPDEPETADLVQELFDAWAPRRARWAESCQPDLGVHRAFQQLYEVWARLERESESWDLVLADAVLDAPAADQGSRIEHPLVLQRVTIQFDADAGMIEVAEGDTEPRLHGSVLRVSAGLSELGLSDVQRRLAKGGVRLNDRHTVAEFARFLVASLFPQGGRALNDGERPGQGVSVRTAPVLILMRRVPGIAEAIDRYLGGLDQVEELPAGLCRVVGDFADGERGPRSVTPPVEVLLTKHANADQEQIVRRLEEHGSVLVQGPPGTGKTHTIANLIGHLLAHGKTILVTSHTTKALRVVREQVVEELRPLCVSVLERDTAARNELEASIDGIVGEFTRTSAAKLDAEIVAGRDLRTRLLQRIASLEGSFRQTCQVRGASLECEGRTRTLEEAARWLREREPTDGWIPGAVDTPAPLAITTAEVDRLYQLNADLTDAEIARLLPPLPDVREFATGDALKDRLDLLAALARGDTTPAFDHPDARKKAEVVAAADALRTVQELIAQDDQPDRWLRVVAEDTIVGGGRAAVWTDLTAKVSLLRERAVALAATEARLRPEVSLDWAIRDQVDVAWAVHAHVRDGGTIGLWFRLWHPRRWWTFVQAASVDGRIPGSAEEFEALAAWLELRRDCTELAKHWDRVVGQAGGPKAATAPGDFLEAAWVWADDIRGAAAWATSRWDLAVAMAREVHGFQADVHLSDSRPTDLQLPSHSIRRAQLDRLEAALRTYFHAILTSGIEAWLTEAVTRATRAQVPDDATGVGGRLLDALRKRDVATYRRERDGLAPLSERRLLVLERKALLDKLVAGAPEWARALRGRSPPHQKTRPPGPADAAVSWKRLQQAFDARVALDPVAIQRELSEVRGELRVATARYVRARAWRAQRDRVDGRGQQRLVGWVDTVRRIGRGTGMRAPRLIAEARRLLAECRDSVPVWIMPLAQALESYDLGGSKFDVVIIDEASQLDVVGVVALALGKQVVVVGDHEQVSPSAVGQQVEPVDALQRQYLRGIPNAHLYVGQTSVYDLARQSFGEMIRLREHFRCAREIIEFSNQLCYGGEIVALRETSAVVQVPHVVSVPTMGSRHQAEKVNHEEAERIVALIVAMLEREEYRDSTFGVISLLGEEQAVLIDQLVARRIPPQERQRRRLVCGTAAQFQGDERQVMLLSVVDSGTGNGPLRLNDRPESKQRLNVAASRAQNQQWVVHSLNPSVDLQPQDLRRRFLEYAANSRAYVETLNRAIDAAESPFEREVIRRLLAKGYKLYPQFQVGAYRIDIVVEGASNKRLAVECDGDRWHGLNQTQADLERQNLLERLGWRFHRIRGGSFYRDPEAEMVKLETALADRDIVPAQTMGHTAGGLPTLADQVMSRSAEILAAWKTEDGPAVERPTMPARDTAVRGEPQPSVVPPAQPERRTEAIPDWDTDAEHKSTGERPAVPVRGAAGTVANHASALLPHLGGTWLSRADLLAMVPLSVPQWNLAIHDLVESGRVETQGEKRGRRYRLASVPRASAVAPPLPAVPNTEHLSTETSGGPPPARRNDQQGDASTPRDPVDAALRDVDPGLASTRCPECGSHCELFVGARGPFLKCQNRGCGEMWPVELATLERAVAANASWRCGHCGGSLHVLEQPTGTFLQCSSRHQEAWKEFRDRVRGGDTVGTQPVHAPPQLRLLRGGVAENDDAK